MEIVAADIGGTHARFAIAQVDDGRVMALGDPVTLKTSEYASIETAWIAFGQQVERPLPRAAAIAVASPVGGEVIRLTNNHWTIHIPRCAGCSASTCRRWSTISARSAHAVAQAPDDAFLRLCGPSMPAADRRYHRSAARAPAWASRNCCARRMATTSSRPRAGISTSRRSTPSRMRCCGGCAVNCARVSVERIVAGPGIVAIHDTLAALEGRAIKPRDATELWTAALEGRDILAVSALDRFCRCLGAVAGDIALAQGANRVVIAGGLGLRLKDRLVALGLCRPVRRQGAVRSADGRRSPST